MEKLIDLINKGFIEEIKTIHTNVGDAYNIKLTLSGCPVNYIDIHVAFDEDIESALPFIQGIINTYEAAVHKNIQEKFYDEDESMELRQSALDD